MAVDINMYGLKYEFSRTSTNGADILITIHKKWYEGEVIKRALGRAPIIKRENKDHIYGTSCELYLECKVDGEFAEMYTSDPYEYRVSVYKNDTLLWIGYVSPELYSEPDIAPPYDVQVIATDGLGELKNKDFEKRGVASLLSHFNYLIGAAMPFSIVSDLRYEDENGVEVAAKEILNIKVNLDHESGENCYDVLQHLLKSLNANITQLNGRYLIFRETDFITKASDAGVEAFDVNGDKIVLPIAMFGSMRSHQWWPVGQLSTVVEPAKNKVTLTAPDNYKNNVLNFASWSLINASYLEKEEAYSLPNKNSAITQSLDFGGQEVGYRLGLRVRARNVGAGQYGGTSDKAQNLGLKVEMEGRAFADYLGPNFWLIKSEGISSGSPLADYMWKSNEERSVEEELRNPSSADSAADAQNIDIVLPLFDTGTNMYGSYAYAKKIKVTIFNPAGEHGIYVYDVSLVKYEQIKGYQADVVIDNAAREAGSDVELTLSPGIYAPAAAEVFMTGLPLQQSGHDIITQWKVGDGQMREYLTAMSYDYSRAVALPKMKYAGILNVPGPEALLPILFLRDGTYYFPKTYSYDLYADEITVELLSISAADVSLGSVVISQTSEAAGTMGGVTTGGASGGGGAVSVPRDKEMSDTSDNAVENRVIKAYVDDLRDQLLDLWHIDENGNLVTDKQVLIKNNLIVEKDTSSGGDGQDTPSAGLDEEQLQNYLDLHKYVTESRVQEMIDEVAAGDVDLTNYYTKQEVDAKIPSLDALQAEVDNIESVLGMDEEAEGIINTWNEVKAFLGSIEVDNDLASILEKMNANIATRALDSDLDTLAGRVGVNELAIADNAGNIKKNFDAITALGKRVTAEETVTNTYASWWADLKQYIKVEGGNIKIDTNLIVTGDTSSGGSGQDTPASGTVTGIKVNGQTYEPTSAGIVTIPDYPTSLEWSAINGKPTALSQFNNDLGLGSLAYLSGITSSMVTGALGYTPLSTSGGTVGNGSSYLPLKVVGTSTRASIGFSKDGSAFGYLTYNGGSSWAVTNEYYNTEYTILHSGNYSDYALPLSGGTLKGSLTISAGNFIMTGYDTVLGFTYPSADNTHALGQIGRRWSDVRTVLLNGNTPITSGNIGSQSVANADKVDGYHAEEFFKYRGWLTAGTDLNTVVDNSIQMLNGDKGAYENSPVNYGNVISFGDRDAGHQYGKVQFVTTSGTGLYYRNNFGGWKDWRQIAFTDSTVEAANKLATARTIWGQSFNGTGNVDGDFYMKGEVVSLAGDLTGGNTNAASPKLWLGAFHPSVYIYTGSYIQALGDGSGYGNHTISFFTKHSSDYTTAPIERMRITPNGNVGIGTTNPAYKLDVNGTAYAAYFKTSTISIDCDADGVGGNHWGEINRFASSLYVQNRTGNLYLSHSEGTTYIRGLASITGAVTMSSTLSVGNDVTLGAGLFMGNNVGFFFKNTSNANVLAMHVDTSNVLQIAYNNVNSVAIQRDTHINGNLVVSGDIASA